MAGAGLTRSRNPGREKLDPAFEQKVLGTQLDRILRHSGTATVISTAFAFILAIYLVPVFGAKAYIWFALKVTSALPRFLCAQAYRMGWWKPSVSVLSTFIWSSFIVDGAVWGLAGIWGAGAHSETVALIVACISSVAMLATFALQIQLKATMAYDQSRFINTAVDNVRDAILIGGLFSILILLAFLRSL